MNWVPYVMIGVLLFTSYRFLIKFSKDEYEELMTALQLRDHYECPTGITLYHLKTRTHLYRIQIQSKLPHNPAGKFKILKRCEIIEYVNGVNDNSHMVDDDATGHSKLNTDDYQLMDLNLALLVAEACNKMAYTTKECELPSSKSVLFRLLIKYPSLSYLFEVVKGPGPIQPIPDKDSPTDWSFRTLVRGIFPGTLWCGFGNIADDTFGQLGDHADTDECCRSHDLCKPIIKAFETRYYFSNPNVIPISHCGCDMSLYNCLRKINTPTSNTIGKIFFNIAKMKCFDFDIRYVCTSSFLGICLGYNNKCVAILKNNKLYPT